MSQDLKLLGRNLLVDIAAADPHDVAQVILQLRQALVELLDVIEGGLPLGAKDEAAWKNAHRIVADLDAGELLWPGWKTKERPLRGQTAFELVSWKVAV
jgi:hypothetical protein